MTRKTSSKPRNVVTLADLAPQRQVLGGGERRVFGADPTASQENRMATKTKDLPAGKNPKGGRLIGNDNLTLVRAAKPTTKDLPAGKDVKAGKKAL